MADEPPSKLDLLLAAIRLFTNNFIDKVAEAKSAIVGKRDEAFPFNQCVFQAFIGGTGGPHGTSSDGAVPSTNLGRTEQVYLHLKLPYTLQDNVEFSIDVDGYNYGASKILDCSFVGRIKNGVYSGFAAETNTHTSGIYTSASGSIMLYIYFPSIYYTSFSINAWCNVLAKKVKKGELVGRVSLSNRMDF